jgi:general secretion pathway protein M
MGNKEDDIRKKTKENLDPKGWEALLEGVPRIKDESEVPASEEPAEKDSPQEKQHILTVTDESGLTTEKSTTRGSASQETPTSQEPSRPGEKEEGVPEEITAPSAPEREESVSSPEETPEPGKPRKKWISLITDRLRNEPQVQKALRYYQQLSQREQRILLAGALFLSVIFVYTFILSPLMEQNTLLNRKIEQKKREIAEMVRLKASVVQDRGGMERIKSIIEQRGKQFSVFAYLEQLATKAEMKDRIVYIKPQRETPVGNFKESLVQIKLEKIGMEALVRYLYQIETSEDLLYVKDLKLKQGNAGNDGGMDVILSVGTLVQGS